MKWFEILWQENNHINVDHLEVPAGAAKKIRTVLYYMQWLQNKILLCLLKW